MYGKLEGPQLTSIFIVDYDIDNLISCLIC